jgi:hypothetical protein
MPPRLTNATLMLDIETEWTLNASLTRFSSYRKCSKLRISGHSAQATSLLPIEGTTKCSRIARGFGCGSSSGFAAEVRPKAGAAHEVWKAGSSVDDCMEITGHKTSSMFKRYADLFSDEEKSAQQRAVQSKRRECKKAQADSVVAMPKRAAIQ